MLALAVAVLPATVERYTPHATRSHCLHCRCQVFFSLGEQMLASTIQFADIFGAIIAHIQYLIVVLKLQFDW